MLVHLIVRARPLEVAYGVRSAGHVACRTEKDAGITPALTWAGIG